MPDFPWENYIAKRPRAKLHFHMCTVLHYTDSGKLTVASWNGLHIRVWQDTPQYPLLNSSVS